MTAAIPFDEEIANRILDEMMKGRTPLQVCRDKGMPSHATVMRWIRKNPEFEKEYDIAKKCLADVLFYEIIDIADGNELDRDKEVAKQMNKLGKTLDAPDVTIGQVRHALLAERQLRINARKDAIAKLAPKKYGAAQQVEIVGDPMRPVTSVTRIEIVAPLIGRIPVNVTPAIEHQSLNAAEPVLVNAQN